MPPIPQILLIRRKHNLNENCLFWFTREMKWVLWIIYLGSFCGSFSIFHRQGNIHPSQVVFYGFCKVSVWCLIPMPLSTCLLVVSVDNGHSKKVVLLMIHLYDACLSSALPRKRKGCFPGLQDWIARWHQAVFCGNATGSHFAVSTHLLISAWSPLMELGEKGLSQTAWAASTPWTERDALEISHPHQLWTHSTRIMGPKYFWANRQTQMCLCGRK